MVVTVGDVKCCFMATKWAYFVKWLTTIMIVDLLLAISSCTMKSIVIPSQVAAEIGKVVVVPMELASDISTLNKLVSFAHALWLHVSIHTMSE